MVSECELCVYRDRCTYIEKMTDNSGSMCDGFIDINFYIDEDEAPICDRFEEIDFDNFDEDEEVYWREMSFRKYDLIDRR